MSYRGLNATTGRAIEDIEHIRQSVRDILTTPVGSRVMRRDYGSLLPELIDQPLNGSTLLKAYAATVLALLKWEPRLRITRVRFGADATGQLTVDLEATRTDGARAAAPANIAVLVRGAA